MKDTYNPFLQIIKSYEGIGRSGVYYKLRKQKTGSKIVCALIVTFLLILISFGINTAKIYNDKELSNFINDIPDFKFENNSFHVDKRYESTTSDTYILVDTDVPYYYNGTNNGDSKDAVDIAPLLKSVGEKSGLTQAMFISETNMYDVNLFTGQVQVLKYSEISSLLNIKSFSKADIQSNYKSFIIKCAVILGIIWLPIRFGLLFLSALIYCVLAQIGKTITKSEDDFNTIYWIAFYVYIAFIIIKTLLKSIIPIGGSMLNMFFFALIIFIILKTLKTGDPDTHDQIENAGSLY